MTKLRSTACHNVVSPSWFLEWHAQISTTGYTRKSGIIILLYFVLTSPHSSITTLLVNFGRSFFSLHHRLLHRLCFARSIRQKMLCREERSLLSWGKRQKAWKLAAIGFTRREVWADFQDFWSNLTYFCKNHSEFGKCTSSSSNSVQTELHER